MHLQLISAAVILFASMFIPLPSPAGLAIALWALATGVPLPAVIGLYVLQDVLSFTAIRKLLPRLSHQYAEGLSRLHARMPGWATAATRRLTPGRAGDATLFSTTLLSFYAGAALAALRGGTPVRSGTVVISADVLKYVYGLLLALGIVQFLPSSPFTLAAASMAGVALAPLTRTTSRLLRAAPAIVPVRVDER